MKTTAVFMAAALVFVSLLAPVSVSADAVGPAPKDCPVGTEGESCHGGPFCDPDECTDDSKCKDGKKCQQLKYCVKQIDCAGGWGKGPYYRNEVKGPCGANGACASGGTCTTLKVCLAGTVAGDGEAKTPSRGCSCDVAGGPGAGLALLLLGLLLIRRRP